MFICTYVYIFCRYTHINIYNIHIYPSHQYTTIHTIRVIPRYVQLYLPHREHKCTHIPICILYMYTYVHLYIYIYIYICTYENSKRVSHKFRMYQTFRARECSTRSARSEREQRAGTIQACGGLHWRSNMFSLRRKWLIRSLIPT